MKDLLAAPIPVIVVRRAERRGRGLGGRLHHDGGARRGDGAGHEHRRGASGRRAGRGHRRGRWARRSRTSRRRSASRSRASAAGTSSGRSKAVRQSVSVAADEAAKLKVVDVVARDRDELFAKIDGRTVEIGGDEAQARAEARRRPDVRDAAVAARARRCWAIRTSRTCSCCAGLLGLYVELTHPGVFFRASPAASACCSRSRRCRCCR